MEQRIHGVGASKGLHERWVSCDNAWHAGDSCIWDDFTNLFVEEKSLHFQAPVTFRNDSRGWRLPVEGKVLSSKSDKAIVFDKFSVDQSGKSRAEGLVTSDVNSIDNRALEEDCEDVSKVTEPISTDVDLDVVSINVNNDIYSINHHQLAAIGSDLSFELQAKSNFDFVHVNFDVTFGNN